MRAFVVLTAAGVLLLSTTPGQAQSADDAAVRAVLVKMFDGMRTADSAVVRSVFAEGARFAMIDQRNTKRVMYQPIDGWLRGIANSARRWDEQLYDVQVRVDGDIAQVWAPYTFYLDRKVRHCGINAIELMQEGTEWKITQLSDTQRREQCRDPLGAGTGAP